jgi:predicted methyltransferase
MTFPNGVWERGNYGCKVTNAVISKRYFRWLFVVTTSLTLLASYAIAQDAEESEQAIERRNRVADILKFLDARPGKMIADVGAGDGFYTVRIARAVAPGGRVIAEDIDQSALSKLGERAAREKVDNVDVILGAADDPLLGTDRFDAILIHNAYHEMVEHEVMLRDIHAALKPGGRLLVVEPMHNKSRGLPREKQTASHDIEINIVARELRAAGFKIEQRDLGFVKFTKEPGAFWLILARRP